MGYRFLLLAVVLFASVFATTGCVTVPAFQRGQLAKPMMSFDPQEDPCATLEASVYAVNLNQHDIVYVGGAGAAAGCPSCK